MVQGIHRPGEPHDRLGVMILRFHPRSAFQLSVQQDANLDHSIVRGEPIPGTGLCGEYLMDISGQLRVGKQKYTETWAIEKHLAQTRPKLSHVGPTFGFVGAGNVTMNPQFIGLVDGALYYVRGQRFDRDFSCLVFGKEGAEFRRMSLDPQHSPSVMGISGPALVENGVPVSETDIIRMAAAGMFYDLRHIIQFPTIYVSEEGGDRLHIDVGLEQFWSEEGLQTDVVRAALHGEPIHLELSLYMKPIPHHARAVGIDAVQSALRVQGYRPVTSPRRAGEFSMDGNNLTLCYYPGIYNHSVLGIDRNGAVTWLGIRGLGNRVGLTMNDTAILVAEYMHNAILIDNGGDVMCQLNGEWLVESAYGRSKMRALIAFAAREDPTWAFHPLQSRSLGSI